MKTREEIGKDSEMRENETPDNRKDNIKKKSKKKK